MLHMAGDIDMLTLPLVCAALSTALNTRPADLVVDLSEVRFCGVRGFVLLAAMARTTATCGIGYAVAGIGPHLDRAPHRPGPASAFNVTPSPPPRSPPPVAHRPARAGLM